MGVTSCRTKVLTFVSISFSSFTNCTAPLETWLGLASALDRLVNVNATPHQKSAAKGNQVYSVSLSKIERTELAHETDISVTYWLRMASYVLFFLSTPYSTRDLKKKPLTTKALSGWWKVSTSVKPFSQSTFNTPEFRSLSDSFGRWVIRIFKHQCHTAKFKIR